MTNAMTNAITTSQYSAVQAVAVAFGWDQLSVKECGLLLWCLFRYYAARLDEPAINRP